MKGGDKRECDGEVACKMMDKSGESDTAFALQLKRLWSRFCPHTELTQSDGV